MSWINTIKITEQLPSLFIAQTCDYLVQNRPKPSFFAIGICYKTEFFWNCPDKRWWRHLARQEFWNAARWLVQHCLWFRLWFRELIAGISFLCRDATWHVRGGISSITILWRWFHLLNDSQINHTHRLNERKVFLHDLVTHSIKLSTGNTGNQDGGH